MPSFSASRLAQSSLIIAAIGLTALAIELGYRHSQRVLPPPPPGGFAYVANAADNSLWAFRYDATSGWLDFTSITVSAGRFPAALASRGHFLYAGNAFGASISGWRVDPQTGRPQALPGSPWPAGKGVAHLVLSADQHYLYASNTTGDSLSAWRLETDGSLAALPGAPWTGVNGPAGLVLAGSTLYVAEGGSKRISRRSIKADGSLTDLVASTSTPDAPADLAADPGGHFLLACYHDSNRLGVWRIGTGGSLSPLPGSPYATGLHPASVHVDSSGLYIYVANEGSNTLGAWRLDDTGLRPLAGAPFATGKGPHTISLSPDGHYLYTSNSGDKSLSGFQIDAASGRLDELPDSPFSTGYGPADLGFVQ